MLQAERQDSSNLSLEKREFFHLVYVQWFLISCWFKNTQSASTKQGAWVHVYKYRHTRCVCLWAGKWISFQIWSWRGVTFGSEVALFLLPGFIVFHLLKLDFFFFFEREWANFKHGRACFALFLLCLCRGERPVPPSLPPLPLVHKTLLDYRIPGHWETGGQTGLCWVQ